MKQALKHGENPHQDGFVVIDRKSSDPLGLQHFSLTSGEPLSDHLTEQSWITLTDLSRGVDTLASIAAVCEANLGQVPSITVLVQHGNACGAAFSQTDDALHLAIDSNYRASFGAFLLTNVAVTKEVVLRLRQWMPAHRPFSGIAAPFIDPKAEGFFARKSGTCHLFVNPALANLGSNSVQPEIRHRSIRGAILSQTPSRFIPRFPETWERSLIEDMCLAWGVCAASASNCITIANNGRLVANAVGQPCRTGACELALHQAEHAGRTAQLKGAAVASDSFFAFADGIDMLARKKVRAIFATSGSMYDEEIANHARQFGDLIFHTVPDQEGRVFSGH
jgi:phosphoribosylaminoimidazolecarboxamide formyltransferase/IMP cyclohydrolase